MAYDWNTLVDNSKNYGKISYYLWDSASTKLQSLKNSSTGSNNCPSLVACTYTTTNFSNKASVFTAYRGHNFFFDTYDGFDGSDFSHDGDFSNYRSNDVDYNIDSGGQ